MSKTCVKQCYRFPKLYRGRGGTLNTLFKILIIFCHWFSKIYEKKKESRGLMHAIASNSSLLLWISLRYATLWHEHNDSKRCQNNPYTTTILVLHYYYLAPVGKVSFQAHHDRCCSLAKLLCIHFSYFNLPNHS